MGDSQNGISDLSASSNNASAKDKNNSQQVFENDSDDCMIIDEVKLASGVDGTFVKIHSSDKFVTPVRKRKGRPPSTLKRKTNSDHPISFSFLQRKYPFSTFADQSEKLYTCPNCGLGFTRPSKYKRHLRSHLINYNAYECKHCIMGFNSSWELYSHAKNHKFNETFKCEQCARPFYHFSTLKRHQLTHLQKPPYKCPLCEATFSTVDKRSRHIANHVIDCVLCDRTFHTYLQFCKHIEEVHRSNNKDKNPQSIPLDEIMSLHPEITSLETIDPNNVEKKMLICFVCEQGFSSKRVLFDHVLAHRVFLCSHCPRFFGTRPDLNYHVLRIHRKDCAVDAKPDLTLAMEGKKKERQIKKKERKIEKKVRKIGKKERKIEKKERKIKKMERKIEKKERKIEKKVRKIKTKKLKLVVRDDIKNIQDNTTKSLQMERDAPFTQNMLDDSILSTRSLKDSNTSSLDLNNIPNSGDLHSFIKELSTASYPLKYSIIERLSHFYSKIYEQLCHPPKLVCFENTYSSYLEVFRMLSKARISHFQSLCDESTKEIGEIKFSSN